jgi:aconitate hydratase
VSAKDVILELLRRHGVSGGLGRILEYHGPGLKCLTAMDRHVIANMGTELGATSTVFPSDEEVRRFLSARGREADWVEIVADEDAGYDCSEEIDLSQIEPLIAMPSSPGNVRPVREVAGQEIYQAYVGSSANPGFRDFAVVARMVSGRRLPDRVSLDVNPTSRQILEMLVHSGDLAALIHAGARIHQAGCNGCIGMGQAPATNTLSLRTVPRNFPGRSGTREDKVCLVSPETAAASALTGVITDPRSLDMPCPRIKEPDDVVINTGMFAEPVPPEKAEELRKGPNIKSLPELEPLDSDLFLPVLLKAADDVSTDEIMPAGARVLPFRSNIPKISEFVFDVVDPSYHERALKARGSGGHMVVGGANYGQGSSREHAALAPRYLGLRVVLAKSFARIHRQNLINFGILPLQFERKSDYDAIRQGDTARIRNLPAQLQGSEVVVKVAGANGEREIRARHNLSRRQAKILLAGGLIPWMRRRMQKE